MSRELLLASGWRRHSVVEASSDFGQTIKADSPAIIKKLLESENALILITTYDCAVVHPDFSNEPWVQVLIVTPVELEKKYTNRRDPRTIHFTIAYKESEVEYQATASGIYQIERELLCAHQPSATYRVSEHTSFDLKIWIAERFRQDTWPDEFNYAVKPAERKLKKFFNRYNEYLTGVYLRLENEIKKDDEKYCISMLIVSQAGTSRKLLEHFRAQPNNKDKTIDQINEIICGEMLKAFGDTIEPLEDPTSGSNKAIAVISEDNITLSQAREFKLFSPHSLSEFGTEALMPLEVIKSSNV